MQAKKLFLGADHAGFELKQAIKWMLENSGYEVEDLGAMKFDVDDDYPDFAMKVAERIRTEGGRGILVCGTGQGIAVAANKVPTIRAYTCWDEVTIKCAAEHGDASIICLGGRTLSTEAGVELVKLWLKLDFSNEDRHIRRIAKVNELEKKFTELLSQ
ncbi:MAG TPA: RpiB/LacA/LacB family sugar-phosphate isomerase [archaeon]|nr:RpiB/LacA/LacB family sugar-phosphate isomerase [archaeon]